MAEQHDDMNADCEGVFSHADLEELRAELEDRADAEERRRVAKGKYKRHDDLILDREDIERGVLTAEELEWLRSELAAVKDQLPEAEARAKAKDASQRDHDELGGLRARQEELETLLERYGPYEEDDPASTS